MQAFGKGILPDSPIYFHTPSPLAKTIYFYPICCGSYHCDQTYIVKRRSYDSYLLIYVISGQGYVYHNGVRVTLKAGSFTFIDCYRPHCYGSEDGWEILWIHFDGPLARRFYDIISSNLTPQSKAPDSTVRNMYHIFHTFHRHYRVDEPLLNKYLTDVLTGFLTSHATDTSCTNSIIEEIRSYIADHPQQDLSLEELAARANLSPYYFLRLFKKRIGCTPHEYLIMVRIDTAKFYLKTTGSSIKDIADSVGFSSASAFCTAFKKAVGCTPNCYRSGQDQAGSTS